MKSGRSLLLFCCLLWLCSGCGQKTEVQEPEELSHVSAEHLLDHQEEALQAKYGNIRLSEGISVTAPEQVSVLECRLRENVWTKENFALLCENFFEDDLSEKQIEQKTNKSDGSRFEITFGKGGEERGNLWEPAEKIGALWEYGAVYLQQEELYYDDIPRVFHIDRGEGADAVYELDGKQISILEAARFVEEWCTKYYSKIGGEQYEYKVKTGYLCQTESGKYSYKFDICLWYQGIPFNDFSINSAMMYSTDADIEDFYDTNYLVAHMNSADRLAYFSNQPGTRQKLEGLIYDPVPHPYEGECLIDLQQALQLLDQKIAVGQKLKIDEIGLVYLPSFSGRTVIPAWYFAIDEEECDEEGNRTGDNRDQSDWLRREIFMDVRNGNQLIQGSNREFY